MKENHKTDELNGIYRDIATVAGVEIAKLMFEEYRGQQVTFPVDFLSRQYIYECIVREFDGCNYKALAAKYNYSERTIRRILKEKKL